MSVRWLPLALAVASCGPLDLTGKLCSSARPCGDGWECFSGVCGLKGTGNKISNGDFESAVTGWTASHGTVVSTTPGRTSASAAQWSPDGSGDSVLTLNTPPVEAPEDGYWCASAWVKTNDAADVGFEVTKQGESLGSNSNPVTQGVWTKLEASGLALFGKPLSVQLTSAQDAGTRQILVDDVSIVKPVSGSCVSVP